MVQIHWNNIKLLIIDLDDTMVDTLHYLSIPKRKETEKIMKQRGLGKHVPSLQKSKWHGGFEQAMKRAKVPESEAKKLRKLYDTVDVKPLKLFADAKTIFPLKIKKVILSRGNVTLQKKKIKHLKLEKYFDEFVIVPTYVDKKELIRKTVKKNKLKMDEVLIIGDRLTDEIRFGKELGIPTVQVKRRGHPVEKSRYKPDLVVSSFKAIARELERHL